MATIKKDVLVKAPEWAKHLRAWGKRAFWRRHRRAEQRKIKEDVES